MYMVTEENKMYVLLRAPYGDSDESSLVVYDIDENGTLVNPAEPVSTKGQVACHLAVKNGIAYCTNYISGSVIKIPDKLVTHTGKGIHPTRQQSPHTHFVCFTPDGKYLCVTDLGLDTVFLYTPQLELVSKASIPAGSGVRHLIFSNDGKYCFAANELSSTVSSFSYFDGKLVYIETVDIIPKEFKNISTASAIRYRDGKIYVSNRGHNSISVIKHNGEHIEFLETFDCGGNSPRDFDFVGDYLISTNEKSNAVAVIDVESKKIICTLNELESPLCILKRFRNENVN